MSDLQPNLFRVENFPLIDAQHAAKILGISSRKLYRLTNKNLQHYKIGGQFRYNIKDVLNFKRKHNL